MISIICMNECLFYAMIVLLDCLKTILNSTHYFFDQRENKAMERKKTKIKLDGMNEIFGHIAFP